VIRFWFSVAASLSILLIVLINLALGLGSFASPHPALAGFESCEGLPCWLGIDLYNSTPYQAIDILEAQGYTSPDDINYLAPEESGLCDLVLGTGVIDTALRISSIQLLNCYDLRLGDVWSLFGTPMMIANDCMDNWVLWYDNTIAIIVPEGLLPQNRVSQIVYYNLGQFGISPYGVPWHGFTTQWRYNQLEGNIRGC
jgi:hypothetical protein